MALTKSCAELAGAMGKNIQQPAARETVMNLLIAFGEAFAAEEELAIQYRQGDEEVVPFDINEARAQWELLRTDLFKPASWFHSF